MDSHRRCAPEQSEEPLAGVAHAGAHRGDRGVRLGQVVAGVRHALRRRPAPLCRDLLALCAAVSRTHGQAAGRQHRRRAAGDCHQSGQPGAHLALDGRHAHRTGRPFQAALRTRRRTGVSRLRRDGAARHGGEHRRPPARRCGGGCALRDHLSAAGAGGHERDRTGDGAVAAGLRAPAPARSGRGGGWQRPCPRRAGPLPPCQLRRRASCRSHRGSTCARQGTHGGGDWR